MDGLVVRTAELDDAEGILSIYSHYIIGTSVTFEFTVPAVDEYRERMVRIMGSYPFLVAEYNGSIVGYAYASRFRSRAAYDWTVETSIYVDDSLHRKGIGGSLYRELEKQLKKRNYRVMVACIAHEPSLEGNNESEAFHERMGFSFAGRMHGTGYKFGAPCDIVWMEKTIGEGPSKESTKPDRDM